MEKVKERLEILLLPSFKKAQTACVYIYIKANVEECPFHELHGFCQLFKMPSNYCEYSLLFIWLIRGKCHLYKSSPIGPAPHYVLIKPGGKSRNFQEILFSHLSAHEQDAI